MIQHRPLCIAAVFLLSIQMVLVAWVRPAFLWKTSLLEQRNLDGQRIAFCGKVYRREEKETYYAYYLQNVQVLLEDQSTEDLPLLVYVEKDSEQPSIFVGNTLCGKGEVCLFERKRNPGNFNQKFYYQKQGIGAAIWCASSDLTVSDKTRDVLREGLGTLRNRWKSFLLSAMGDHFGGSMAAILLGEKSALEEETKALYRQGGISHILAISGLHMSFLGAGLYRILRKMGLGFLPAGLLGISLLFFYTMMIGESASAWRAMSMFSLRVGADMAGRRYDLPTALALAAVLIGFLRPLYLVDAGFLLSFGAIFGIGAILPILDKPAEKKQKSIEPEKHQGKLPRAFGRILGNHFCQPWKEEIFRSIWSSLSIYMVILPLLCYFYFEFSPYSLLINLLVIPLMSVVLGMGVLGSALGIGCPFAGKMVLLVCRGILQFYETLCSLTLGLPGGRVVIGQPKKWQMAVYYGVLFGLWVWNCFRQKKQKGREQALLQKRNCRRFRIALSAMLCLFLILSWGNYKADEKVQITMIDVGQGEGIYVKSPDNVRYFIDGGSSDVDKVGQYRIAPYLKSVGVGKLDYVFLSHGDQDHVSGIQELLTDPLLGVSIDTVVLPGLYRQDTGLVELAEVALQAGVRVVVMEEGQVLCEESGFQWTCLAPSQEYQGEIGNQSSMVLRLTYGTFQMLFTGDLEKTGEDLLVESGYSLDCDVLKVGHHGSKNATGEDLLTATTPALSFISAGADNSYGHPAQETLERLQEINCSVYCTKERGAILLTVDGSNMAVHTYW